MSSQNKIGLEQKNVQRQVGLPLTVQLMHLVELPYASLEQEVRNAVEDNPALEIYDDDAAEQETHEEVSREEYDANGDPLELSNDQLPEDEIFKEDYYRDSDDYDEGFSDAQLENYIAKVNAPDEQRRNPKSDVYYESMREQWQWQLDEMEMTERQSQIATYLMGTLDDAGYLHADLQAIVNELLYTEYIQTDIAEVEYVLTHFVQELDPPGTGARNLQECLLLQLDRIPDPTPAHQLARVLISQYFDLLTKRHYDKILSLLMISNDELKAALDVVQKLDPRPASQETPMQKNAETIIPDFTITNSDGKLTLTLNNQYVPKVRINKAFSNEYRFLSKEEYERRSAEAEKFIKKYVDDGQQFIKTLSLREMLLYNTMYAIMQHQRDYFLSGDNKDLKPMILKTIAQEVGADISTISRVSNSKYVQTDFGIIPLKHLFSEAVNDDDVSSKEIKQILGDLVEAEDKKKPLSDDKICALLNEKGYNIARRTVAKYREQMGIPVARLRKEL
ncbi:MAG: RNA polymerase factor sigma-54 [Bacteroidales bacterium]|nr:RNA polymerase factor sigma-54 [Bacteroidales bacterium]